MSVKDRLEAAKNKGQGMSENAALAAAQIYTSIKGEVDRKSKEELRREVLAEMESKYSKTISDLKSAIISHKADIKSGNAEAVAEKRIADSLNKVADKKIESLKSEISSLKAGIREKAQNSAVNKQELAENAQSLKDDLKQEQLKVSKLELKIATLTGKLSEKKPVNQAQKIIAPAKMPSFKVEPIRGQDGRVVSATITPIGLN